MTEVGLLGDSMAGEHAQEKAEGDQRNQGNRDEPEATLEFRNLIGSRQDAGRPGEPGGIGKNGYSDREQDRFAGEASPPRDG